MWVSIYVSVYACIYISTDIDVNMDINIYIDINLDIDIHVCRCIYIYTISFHISVPIYCIYVYIIYANAWLFFLVTGGQFKAVTDQGCDRFFW